MRKTLRRNLPMLTVLLALAVFVGVAYGKQARALPTGSWGLSFQTEGEPPTGNASSEALREYNAVYLGDTTQKVIYLTFDAGYENGCTAQILDVLKKHNVSAAFFLVGNYIEQNPELVKRMAGGKTGTAQTGQFTPEGTERCNLWFAGFWPAEKPRYTIVVLQDGAVHTAYSGAAIFAQVCTALEAAG